MPSDSLGNAEQPSEGRRDLAAGLLLGAAGALVLWFTKDLEFGTSDLLGPGFMPRVAATGLGLLSGIMVFHAVLRKDEPMEDGSWRAIVFVSVSLCLFAATVRAVGLFPSGVLLCVVSGFASPPVRLKSLLVYSILSAAAVCVVFKYLLGIQLPAIAFPRVGGF